MNKSTVNFDGFEKIIITSFLKIHQLKFSKNYKITPEHPFMWCNKIVSRFYETRLRRSDWRKAKIPIPVTRLRGISDFLPQPSGLRHRTFALKGSYLLLYLNSSRAESSEEFKFKKP